MMSPQERHRRDRAIAVLRAFAAGKLTNDEFEDRFQALCDERPVRQWEDRALWAFRTFIWYWYDDQSEHRMEGRYALNQEQKRSLARCILFLQTDRAYEWPRYDFIALDEVLLNWITLGWWRRYVTKRERIDWNIWPFRHPEDVQHARSSRRRGTAA